MRKSTIASLLILCGSTAALAQVAPRSGQTTGNTTAMANEQATGNMTTANDTMTNDMMSPTAPDTSATPTPMDDTTTNTTEPPTGR